MMDSLCGHGVGAQGLVTKKSFSAFYGTGWQANGTANRLRSMDEKELVESLTHVTMFHYGGYPCSAFTLSEEGVSVIAERVS